MGIKQKKPEPEFEPEPEPKTKNLFVSKLIVKFILMRGYDPKLLLEKLNNEIRKN